MWSTLHIEVYEFLDSIEVNWSTIDPVRFAEEGKDPGPVYLWIGVEPQSLSLEDAKTAAFGCKRILAKADLPDIEIAFRESRYIRSSGPRLLEHDPFEDPADIRYPFTLSLGIHIAPKNTPHFEGTGALYLRESSESRRVFLLTARHVALPPPEHPNRLYVRKNRSKPRADIVILGQKGYTNAVDVMMEKIEDQHVLIETYQRELDRVGEAVEGEKDTRTRAREICKANIARAEQTISDIDDFHSIITKHWTTPSCRVLGYVLHAPPISLAAGPKRFTEDWALIDLDLDKFDWDTFKGNVVYLGAFQSALPRLSSLTIISRQQDVAWRIRPKDGPSS